MPGNSAFILVSERGWRRGMGIMLRSEFARWWKTRMWWIQCLIWVGIIGFLLGAILFRPSSPLQPEPVALMFAIFAGLFPSVGVVIIMQGAVVGEKKDGTATWVLSKPITRPAFLLSKMIANSVGILVTMVVLPGIMAYVSSSLATGRLWNPLGFLAALGVIFLNNFFFLSFSLMLGTLFNNRGAVIGIALGLLFLQQYLIGWLPGLRYVLPWNLIVPMGQQVDSMVPCLILGCQNLSYITLTCVVLESILFILVGLFRFSREEL